LDRLGFGLVSDPVQTSKTAREGLARGLNALQGDPSVPPHLVELAQPIAQAMGALHQIEKTGQLAPHAEVALNHVRGAMSKLQAQPATHPAVAAALEAVAGSLSLVHSLGKMANGPAPAPPPQAAPVPNTAAMPQRQAPPQQMAPQGPPPGFPPPQQMPPQHMAPQHHMPPPQQMPPQQQQRPPQQMAPQVARDPFAASDPFAAPRGAPPQGGPPPGFHGQPQGGQVNAPPAGNVQIIPADLGAHSPTNFYKGLSGNDIIDHGGLFVSTYVPPKVGTPVRLKVSLPGGYEFEANAVVKWVREQGEDAAPGFGAQFTQITQEARQLVYRYVRNREPLFHDDL
jgi:uncharacterized protein (TIGR02266 family)